MKCHCFVDRYGYQHSVCTADDCGDKADQIQNEIRRKEFEKEHYPMATNV